MLRRVRVREAVAAAWIFGAAGGPALAAELDVAHLFGATGADEGHAVAVDRFGRIYVAGSTSSTDLATTPGVTQPDLAGGTDAVIARFEADGTLSYLTYLGGSSLDTANDIAIDADGNAYVVGETNSSDFPTTAEVLQDGLAAASDGWVAKLDDGGALAYATYLGGAGGLYAEGATAVAVDAQGHAYVTGRAPAGFPVTEDAFQQTLGGQRDAFVAKLAPDATSLVYATYLGGPGDEEGTGIAVDADGSVSVAGRVLGPVGFPTTPGAFQPTPSGGGGEGFVARLTADGADLVHATFLGGSANDQIFDLALGPEGDAFVVGHTTSADFPTTAGALREDPVGSLDLFVAALAANGAALRYATYVGGTGFDQVCSSGDPFQLPHAGITVDAAGRASIAACTSSRYDFPLAQPLRATTATDEGIVATLDPAGASLLFSSYLGGSSSAEGAFDVASDATGRVYVTGATASTDFATTPGSPTPAGASDAFVVRITTPEPAALQTFVVATAALSMLWRSRR